VSEIFGQRLESGRTLNPHLPVDESFELPDGKRLFEKETIYVARVNTTKSFGEDKRGYYEERTDGELIGRLQKNSDLQFMKNRSMTAVIPGYHMLSRKEKTSVGCVIDIQVPKDQPAYKEKDPDKLIDKKRSGKFIITSCRHKFALEGLYHAAIELQRIGTEDPITDSEQRPDET
jgi:hypothetical protein